MTMLERLLPANANNDYGGSKIALYALPLISTVLLGRSLIHFFKGDSGVNSIASIHVFPGTPDPNQVIYMFSALWGSQQLIMVVIIAIVAWRYRSLIPLMYGLLVLEVLFRLSVGVIHPLTPEYYERRPPGAVGNLPMLVVFATMFVLSLRPARGRAADRELARAAQA